MIDLSKDTIASYQAQVCDIYKQLEKEGWSNLKLFEWRCRRISILNMKIKCRAADLGKSEGEYSNNTI